MLSVCTASVLLVGSVLFFVFLKAVKRSPSTKGRRARHVRPLVSTVIASRKGAPYELDDLYGPVVHGYLFKLLSKFIFTPLGKALVITPALEKSNNHLLAGEYLPEDPVFQQIPSPKNHGIPQDGIDNHDQINRQAIDELSLSKIQARKDVFRYNSILDFYHAYKETLSTPTEVTQAILEKIAESNKLTPPFRAFIYLDISVVMAMAEASTDRWKSGQPLSYLDGVPVAVKGEVLLEPYPILGGSKFKAASYENIIEGELIRRLREAGAVLIGVTNMQEFGMGTLGSNPNMGMPRNPHNPAHYCGGSSSGSGASVAAGLCPLAIGADGGGSIRVPAALCGVTGLKPTAGLLDNSGMAHLSYTVGVVGPLASSCLDIAIAMDVFLKGSRKSFSLHSLGDKSLSGLKMGVYSKYCQHGDKEVVACFDRTVSVLKGLGAEIKEIVIPELEETRVAHLCLIVSEMYSNLAIDVDKNFDGFNPETLLPLCCAADYDSREYVNSLKQKTRSIKIMEAILNEVDVVLTPSTAIPSPMINPKAVSHGISDVQAVSRLMRYAFIANITGLPAITVPAGFSANGLPIGVQIMGHWYDDGLLVRIGHALESNTAPVLKKPHIYYDILNH